MRCIAPLVLAVLVLLLGCCAADSTTVGMVAFPGVGHPLELGATSGGTFTEENDLHLFYIDLEDSTFSVATALQVEFHDLTVMTGSAMTVYASLGTPPVLDMETTPPSALCGLTLDTGGQTSAIKFPAQGRWYFLVAFKPAVEKPGTTSYTIKVSVERQEGRYGPSGTVTIPPTVALVNYPIHFDIPLPATTNTTSEAVGRFVATDLYESLTFEATFSTDEATVHYPYVQLSHGNFLLHGQKQGGYINDALCSEDHWIVGKGPKKYTHLCTITVPSALGSYMVYVREPLQITGSLDLSLSGAVYVETMTIDTEHLAVSSPPAKFGFLQPYVQVDTVATASQFSFGIPPSAAALEGELAIAFDMAPHVIATPGELALCELPLSVGRMVFAAPASGAMLAGIHAPAVHDPNTRVLVEYSHCPTVVNCGLYVSDTITHNDDDDGWSMGDTVALLWICTCCCFCALVGLLIMGGLLAFITRTEIVKRLAEQGESKGILQHSGPPSTYDDL